MSDDRSQFGVDLDKSITLLMARDALVDCFFEAHCVDTGMEIEGPAVNKRYANDVVKKGFYGCGRGF